MQRYSKLKEHIVSLIDLRDQLRELYPGKNFPLDGKLVGDIGEVYAETHYGIELYPKQVAVHDGFTSDKRKVQIKATFGHSLTFKTVPDYYLGFKIHENGDITEIYNGPGQIIADYYQQRKGLGEKLLGFPISKLTELSASIAEKDKIKRIPHE